MNNLMTKLKLDKLKIFSNYKIWFIVPICILFIMLLCGTVYSFIPNIDGFANIGIDFQGGTVLSVEMTGESLIGSDALYKKHRDVIEKVLSDNGIKIGVAQSSGTSAIIVRYKNNVNGYNLNSKAEEMDTINRKVCDDIETKLKEIYPNNADLEVKTSTSLTSASASSKLLKTAFLSVGIAILLMLIYIMIRFDLFSGLSSIIALLHDIIMMLAFTVIFRIQINSTIVAAIITIVAYSINNTIIIFDRIRESVKPFKTKNQKMDIAEIVDTSVKQTFTRSIFTTLTTMVTIIALAILGVASIKEFAYPILFGLVSGFYSSVCIAPSIWGLMTERKLNGPKKKDPNAKVTKTKDVKSKDKAIAFK